MVERNINNKKMRPKKEKPTIQEKFMQYYDSTRKDYKKLWRFQEAIKQWNANETVRPPYSTFESFVQMQRRAILKS